MLPSTGWARIVPTRLWWRFTFGVLDSSFKHWRSRRVGRYRTGLLDRFKSPPDGCEACVTPIGGPCPRSGRGGGYGIEGLYGAESARMPGTPRALRADGKRSYD